MPPEPLPLDEPRRDLPPAAEALVADAYERIAASRRADAADTSPSYVPAPSFVPADYRVVYAGLAEIHARRLAPNQRMCEWGSGLGVVASLAAQLGFAACGIEAQPGLVDQARDLASHHGLQIDFATGSYVPASAEHLTDFGDELATLTVGIAPGYDELDHAPEDFGLIYAFPWPGEEPFMERLFESVAGDGALLLTYRSTGDVILQRFTSRSAINEPRP